MCHMSLFTVQSVALSYHTDISFNLSKHELIIQKPRNIPFKFLLVVMFSIFSPRFQLEL